MAHRNPKTSETHMTHDLETDLDNDVLDLGVASELTEGPPLPAGEEPNNFQT
jgi:hypothetical protein